MKKGIEELSKEERKKFYNTKYLLKTTGYKGRLLEINMKDFKSKSEYHAKLFRLEKQLFKERQKKYKKSNFKRYVKNAIENKQFLTNAQRNKIIDTAKNKLKNFTKLFPNTRKYNDNNELLRHQGNWNITKGESREFYKQRDLFNKKRKKELKDLKKNNRKLYDFIYGEKPNIKGLGDYSPTPYSKFTFKDRDNINSLFSKEDFKAKMKFYNRYNDENWDIDKELNMYKENVFNIFLESGKYSTVDEETKNLVKRSLSSVDNVTFQVWYENNRDKIRGYYFDGRLDSVGIGDDEIKENLITVVEDIKKYQETLKSYYGY